MREPEAPRFEDLLAALEMPTPCPPGGRTTDEWAEYWRTSPSKTSRLLRFALKSGRMKTTKTMRPDDFRPGRRVWVYLHAFVAPKRKAKR